MSSILPTSNLITETNFFTVERHPEPFIDRKEGGHIRLFPKREGVRHLNDLTPEEAIDLIRTESLVREAMLAALPKQGINIVWVNICDLGNWAFKRHEEPRLHIHMLGRASDAINQKWPEAPYLPDRSSGFYKNFEPLSQNDMLALRNEIDRLDKLAKYQKETWHLP